jgi:hypothetical protein
MWRRDPKRTPIKPRNRASMDPSARHYAVFHTGRRAGCILKKTNIIATARRRARKASHLSLVGLNHSKATLAFGAGFDVRAPSCSRASSEDCRRARERDLCVCSLGAVVSGINSLKGRETPSNPVCQVRRPPTSCRNLLQHRELPVCAKETSIGLGCRRQNNRKQTLPCANCSRPLPVVRAYACK